MIIHKLSRRGFQSFIMCDQSRDFYKIDYWATQRSNPEGEYKHYHWKRVTCQKCLTTKKKTGQDFS